MKFRSERIAGVVVNQGDLVGKAVREMQLTDRIVVAQGFGVPAEKLPLRLAAYVVGTMRLLQQLPNTSVTELYIALNGVLRANGCEQEEGGRAQCFRRSADEMAKLLRLYVDSFHPALASQVRILVDSPIGKGTEVDCLIDRLMPHGEEIARTDSSVGNFVAKRGGTEALRYMIEHTLYMRDPLAGTAHLANALVGEATTNMQHLIMIGGQAERVFHKVRLGLLAAIGSHNQWRSHQFFVKSGDTPTYHLQLGEPVWGDNSLPGDVRDLLSQSRSRVDNQFGAANHVVRDTALLLADAAGENCDFQCLEGIDTAVAKGQAMNPRAEELLQSGWRRLRQLWS
jgi:hypothetical protein